jgi:hypothetical protein
MTENSNSSFNHERAIGFAGCIAIFSYPQPFRKRTCAAQLSR